MNHRIVLPAFLGLALAACGAEPEGTAPAETTEAVVEAPAPQPAAAPQPDPEASAPAPQPEPPPVTPPDEVRRQATLLPDMPTQSEEYVRKVEDVYQFLLAEAEENFEIDSAACDGMPADQRQACHLQAQERYEMNQRAAELRYYGLMQRTPRGQRGN